MDFTVSKSRFHLAPSPQDAASTLSSPMAASYALRLLHIPQAFTLTDVYDFSIVEFNFDYNELKNAKFHFLLHTLL